MYKKSVKVLLRKSVAFLIALTMFFSLLPSVLASAYSVGSSFKIYSNPMYTGNSAYGRSYVWALAPDAKVFGNSASTEVTVRYFWAGDGIIHEPTPGSLDGFNTRVTVRHKEGFTKNVNIVRFDANGNVLFSKDSDLAAVVTYVENGVVKKSPAYRFTGFHYTNKQTHDPALNGTITDYDLGVYPNVVNVNVYHILSSPVDATNDMKYSEPYHEYVQFDVVGTAGTAQLPPNGKYYIETKVLPNADKGIPMGTPTPVAKNPTSGSAAEPLVLPNTINASADVVSFGLGTRFTLFPEDKPWDTGNPKLINADSAIVNNLGTNVAPIMNGQYGITKYEVPVGGTITAFSAYGSVNSKVSGATGIKAIYLPKQGTLNGVITEVKAIQFMSCNPPGPQALIKYDGGKETTVSYYPASFDKTYFNIGTFTLGSFLNLESVSIVSTSSKEQYMPSLEFRVINENPDLPNPNLPVKKYTKPNIPTVTPDPSSPVPVPNVSSPLSINEAVAGNKTGITAKDGQRYDWVEIYNNSSSNADVTGYGLTDSPKTPKKWVFPSGSVVPANGYLLVMASGKNTVIDGEIHTSFSISNETLMLSNPDGGILSVLDLPKLEDDQAFARYPDGSDTFKITVPTSGASNNNSEIISSYVSKPDFSAKSGFYSNSFNLSLTSQGGTIHYTMDGSTPTAASPTYSTSLSIVNCTQNNNILANIQYFSCKFQPSVKIDKSMVVRAVVIDAEGNSSEVVTKSYFVGFDMARDFNNAMVISMTTDKDGLFDDNYGIFTNVEEQRKEFERQVHLDFFDKDGKLIINQDAGVRTRGFGNKYVRQKGINFYARSEYGKSTFEFPLFNNSKSFVDGSLLTEYKSVALRNGSTNWDRFMFKDGEAQGLTGEAGTAFQAQRPVVLFINGEYWGIYYMAERATDDYVEEHYNIPKENVIVIKNHVQTGDATADDLDLYIKDRNWLASTDFTNPENYKQLTAKFDIQNLMLYYAANVNIQAGDWIGYNFCSWRSRYITDKPYEDGKWRFMMYDSDTAYDGNYLMSPFFSGNERGWGVALLNNPSLKKIFANIILDSYANELSPESSFEDLYYWYEEEVTHLIDMHDRWNLPSSQAGEVTAMYKIMMKLRPQHINDIKNLFGFKGNLAYLNVRVSDSKAGNVKVNYLDRDFSKGSFSTWNFTDNTSTLEAVPKPGYRFTGWKVSDGTTLSSDTDKTTNVTLALNGSRVTANFAPIVSIVGMGTENDPYQISNADELEWMSDQVNNNNTEFGDKYYALTNNIVLTNENTFNTIGNENNTFKGKFDGRYHTIGGLNISSTSQGQGLFGFVGTGGYIKNVGVTNTTIVSTGTEGKNVGGIVGNNAGIIENCYTTGSLSGISTVGGIAGNNSGGAITNCYSIATINSESSATRGGIAGKVELSGSVSNCYSLIIPVAKADTGTVVNLTSIKSADDFSNGMVTKLLNANSEIWANGGAAPIFIGGMPDADVVLSYAAGKVKIISRISLTDAKLVWASYENGILKDIKIQNYTAASDSTNEVTLPEDLVTVTGGKIKILLWSNIGNIAPITYYTVSDL